jgi:hypothetical protein
MVSGMAPQPCAGDAERPECARDRYAIVGLEPTLDFALSLVITSGLGIFDQDAPWDVLGAPTEAIVARQALAMLRSTGGLCAPGRSRARVAWRATPIVRIRLRARVAWRATPIVRAQVHFGARAVPIRVLGLFGSR